eukprot:TRINITY_DN1009_c0_g1_i1.p1 TRINITY_DN1009_c0_g1~~TRINITY_DN1009_c0_g1_i1.p1  ORF type:complete len:100 (-),score=20.45 TRINITY_DN1009_c0_g1_i1:526-825(-)
MTQQAPSEETMNAIMMEAQQKEQVNLMGSLTKRCFQECINNFKSRSNDPTEEQCLRNCVRKYMAANMRMSARFGEEAMLAEKMQMEAQQAMAKGTAPKS